ncbi:MAG: MG2 domain-containing protein [Planctomycetaceae bacterium]
MSNLRVASLGCLLAAIGALYLMADDKPIPGRRAEAEKLLKENNWRDAYNIYSQLVFDKANGGEPLADDFSRAADCLAQLQQLNQLDALRVKAVEVHGDDWRLLERAARSLIDGQQYGFVVAGEFRRADQRGGGEYVSSSERDRVEALRLFHQAAPLVLASDAPATHKGVFYRNFARAIMSQRDHGNAWELQDLTDLESLPDYVPQQRWWGRGGQSKGAAVDAEGQPIFYHVPDSWDAAKSDGERWRWCLTQMAEVEASLADEADWTFANFQQQQFGVRSMLQWGIALPRVGDAEPGADGDKDESGPFALPTLQENETIAKLANGVKRFEIPDEFHFIAIYKKLAAGKGGYAEAALNNLANIFSDRQQYPRAAGLWRENIQRFGDRDGSKKSQLDQIVANWGQFEPVRSQGAGSGATVDFRYRNASRVSFTAHAIKHEQLLADVKAYLKSNPQQLDWQRMQIDNIGYRLVQENQNKYLGAQVAQWDLELKPRPSHFDRRVTVATPLQKAGAYLVEAKLADGNISRIIIWIDDTAIVKKQLNNQALYYVADATTGAPIEKANVEFFGWTQEAVPNTRNQYRVITRNYAEFTDAEGLLIANPKDQDRNYQWLIMARTDGGRLAYMGFTGIWYGQYHDQQYNETKTYVVSDRPVYRPDQKVQFKFWMRETKYDIADGSRFKNLEFNVRINDPQGTEVFQQKFTTDEYGGLAGEYVLPAEAKLGQYSIFIDHAHGVGGGGSFRVEEYKKPEFEVLVEAPTKPVQLGDTVTATIRAKYYFGAPVTNATVKLKVERTPHEARWYPAMPWDWLYGEGYWWFAPDSTWYPGFARWGCFAPRPSWFNWNPDPPELVLDRELEIGEDGTVEFEIDTSLAKALHADEDHKYAITAEVVDASRRTIVGSGQVLVAREPFKVFVWTERGHYNVGDTIHAHFQARTLDGNGVEGQGHLKLFRITYGENRKPVENLAQEWDLDTDADGQAAIEIKASEPGQYRLSYVVEGEEQENGERRSIEGGYLFVIRGEGFDGSEFQFGDLELITDKAEYSPGEEVKLLINTNRVGSKVLLFLRPSNGVYAGRPQLLKLDGKSITVNVGVVQKDMPNFFIEALTIADGKVYSTVREVIVPPEQRVINVDVVANTDRYLPGAKADVQVKLTDADGNPFVGSVVLSVYDRAIEYISGGSNVGDIKSFFWKWRRSHNPRTEDSLSRYFYNLLKSGELGMQNLGAFGNLVADLDEEATGEIAAATSEMGGPGGGAVMRKGMNRAYARGLAAPMAADAAPAAEMAEGAMLAAAAPGMDKQAAGGAGGEMVQPTVRTNFADSAYWNATLTTDADGVAFVSFDMPENLTDWKFRAWGMGGGTRVGEGTASAKTAKNLLVRLQAPRFFVEKDEVVLSAIVHNYLETEKARRSASRSRTGSWCRSIAHRIRIPSAFPPAAKCGLSGGSR